MACIVKTHVMVLSSTVEIKDYNIMIDERDFFNQLVRNHVNTCENIKIATGYADGYSTVNHPYFKKI